MSCKPSNKNVTEDERKKALERWRILARALRGERAADTCNNAASVRRFSSFGLLHTDKVLHPQDDEEPGVTWFKYTCPCLPDFHMSIRHLPGTIKADTIFGFNNTGNVCVWPSEEILCYHCRKNLEQFQGSRICELGGGMTCLAGVLTAILSQAGEVMLTDGNEESVKNLKMIAEHKENQCMFGDTKVTTKMLRWGSGSLDPGLQGAFDFVLCADCLFFKDGREDLIDMVYDLLVPQGKAIMFAPKRGETFDEFVSLAKRKFVTTVKDHYDETVWELHCKMKDKGLEHYDENLHYPIMLILDKENKS